MELVLQACWSIGLPGGHSFDLTAHGVSIVFQWLGPLFYMNSGSIKLLVLSRFLLLNVKSGAILADFRNLPHIVDNIWWWLVLKLDLRLVASQSIKLTCIVGMGRLIFREKSLSRHDGLDLLRSSCWLSIARNLPIVVFLRLFIATYGRRTRKTWRLSHFCVHVLIR